MTVDELKNKRIAILMGGPSAEREVSLRTGQAALAALTKLGYQAEAIDAGFDLVVYNRTRSKADELEKKGAKVAGSSSASGTHA